MRYHPFDQHEKLGNPPWSGPVLEQWEQAHGHDVRLKCYPEYGCQAILADYELLEDVIDEIAKILDDAGVPRHDGYEMDITERVLYLAASVTDVTGDGDLAPSKCKCGRHQPCRHCD